MKWNKHSVMMRYDTITPEEMVYNGNRITQCKILYDDNIICTN